MCINLALAEGRFNDAIQLIAAVMRLSGKQVSKETLTHLTALSGEFGVPGKLDEHRRMRLN
jgi:hypothetical protein